MYVCCSAVAICFFPVNSSKYASVFVYLFFHSLTFAFLLLELVKVATAWCV